MNTRIYFNTKFIELTEAALQSSQDQSFISDKSSGAEKKLSKLVRKFLEDPASTPLYLPGISIGEVLPLLQKSFYYIEAAGGFIEKKGEYLFIRRHDRWDLPKGKLEKGEGIREAAIRECEEECGITGLEIIRPLPSTFHIYPFKDGYALKQSYWFYMQSDFGGELVPQLEESITEVRWFSPAQITSEVLKDTYYTIADVTREALGI